MPDNEKFEIRVRRKCPRCGGPKAGCVNCDFSGTVEEWRDIATFPEGHLSRIADALEQIARQGELRL